MVTGLAKNRNGFNLKGCNAHRRNGSIMAFSG